MSACFHEIHIDVNIYWLRFLALLAINYARVFVPSQVMHQLVFPFELLIIRVAKRVINILLLVLLVLQHKSHRRTLHTIQCECFLKFEWEFFCHRLLINESTKWYHGSLLPVSELATYFRQALTKRGLVLLTVRLCSVVVNMFLVVL